MRRPNAARTRVRFGGKGTRTQALLSGLLIGLTPIAAAACTLNAVSVIPTLLFAGHYILAADINGKRANLIADTGASTTNLAISSAPRFGVSLNLRNRENQGIGGGEQAYSGFARTLRISQLILHGQFVGGTAVSADPQIDGVLGMDVLTSYDIDLDFIGQHILLFDPAGDCSVPTVALARPLYSAHLVYIRGDALAEVDVFIGGTRVRALIDSGSPGSVLFRRAASRLNLDLARFNGPDHHESRGIGPNRVKSFTQTFPSITIGDFALRGLPVEILDQRDFGFNRIHTGSLLVDDDDGQIGGEQMILGADFLDRVHVWISHSSHRLIMQYPPKPSEIPK